LETIIETAYYLNKLNFKFQWNIAGVSYNDPLIKLVKSKLKNSYTENSINFLGRLTSEKLIDFMLNSNIYVTTSHIENSPNNLAEAMMLGMPCIATNAGGTSTYIKDGENGILLQDGDPWALAGTILELAGNSALSCEIGKNARETALSRHNKIRIIDDVLGTYSSIVANSK
jgi:glycosyltransferase involved in cell wall biosynthesis